MQLTEHGLSQLSVSELRSLQRDLLIERMKLDKFFSVFLDNTEFDPKDTSNPDTITYNEMSQMYRKVTRMIDITNFYINKNDRYSIAENRQRVLTAH